MRTEDRMDTSHIEGWGADLDRGNRPAVPKERTPPRLSGIHWDQPAQQPQDVAVLRSIERDSITPVFGSAVPPSGVSGFVRRRAYRLSENDVRHWLMLLAADRINVLEGLLEDARGASRGKKLAAGVVLAAVGYLVVRRLRRR